MITSRIHGKTVAIALALSLATGLNAQDQSQKDQRARRANPVGSNDVAMKEICRVSNAIGADVKNRQGESLGIIYDIAITQKGEFKYMVLSSGGVAGVGTTYYAIPWDQVKFDYQEKSAVLNLDQAKLEQLPPLESKNYREFSDPMWRAKLHASFRAAPADRDGQAPKVDGSEEGKDAQASARFLLASKIIGANVLGQLDKDLGEVHDLIVQSKMSGAKTKDQPERAARETNGDTSPDQRQSANRDTIVDAADHVAFAVLDIGGTLGVGETQIAIPFSELNLRQDEDNAVTVQVAMSEAQIMGAPALKREGFADLKDQTFVTRTRQYFGADDRSEIETESPNRSKPAQEEKQPDKPKRDR